MRDGRTRVRARAICRWRLPGPCEGRGSQCHGKVFHDHEGSGTASGTGCFVIMKGRPGMRGQRGSGGGCDFRGSAGTKAFRDGRCPARGQSWIVASIARRRDWLTFSHPGPLPFPRVWIRDHPVASSAGQVRLLVCFLRGASSSCGVAPRGTGGNSARSGCQAGWPVPAGARVRGGTAGVLREGAGGRGSRSAAPVTSRRGRLAVPPLTPLAFPAGQGPRSWPPSGGSHQRPRQSRDQGPVDHRGPKPPVSGEI
jgi:hypothetical protein